MHMIYIIIHFFFICKLYFSKVILYFHIKIMVIFHSDGSFPVPKYMVFKIS